MLRGDLPAVARIVDDNDMFPSAMLQDMSAPYFGSSSSPPLGGPRGDQWYVALVNDEVVGVAFVAPEKLTDRVWNLLCIAVLPSHHSTGVGRALIEAAEAALKEASQRLLLVETIASEAFARQHRFYERNGFVLQGTVRDYYEDGQSKAIFSKRLTDFVVSPPNA